MSMLEIIGH